MLYFLWDNGCPRLCGGGYCGWPFEIADNEKKVVVVVTEGKLDFGPWEQIFSGEFDRKRRKRVLVKIIGE